MGGTVVIAGGSGLVGEALCYQLVKQGYTPRLLSRSAGTKNGITAYKWDPSRQEIDHAVWEGAEYVINLAGENVGKGRWTIQRKKQLIDSRLQSTQLLVNEINTHNLPIKKFIQASAVGYYGFGDINRTFEETDGPGTDFLAQLSKDWEDAVQPLNPRIPSVIIRIGVVFSSRGGAFTAMAKPIRLMVGTPLGRGTQPVPWIHIEDLVHVFIHALQSPIMGVYNAVSPDPKTNKDLTKAIGKACKRPVWPVPAPGFLLKLLLGEQAQIVLEGNRVSSKKLQQTGFTFKFPTLQDALRDLIK